MTTVRAFTFDPSNMHPVRRCEAATLSFVSPEAGALMIYDLDGGPYPAGTVVDITVSVSQISGIVPEMFFSGGGDTTNPPDINATGDDQVVHLTFMEPASQIQHRVTTSTTARCTKLLIDVTPLE